MPVEIEPTELSFRRPFTEEVSRDLKIINLNSTPIAFKVKTTAPKQYCVRPNSGRVEPGHDVVVTVLLQAMKEEPPLNAKCRDKFLVQSAPITADKQSASIASVLDSTDKSQLQEKKIRVIWLAAEEQDDASPSVVSSTAVSSTATPSRSLANGGYDATPDVSKTFSSPGEDTSPTPPPYTEETDVKRALDPESPTPVSALSFSKPRSSTPMSYDDLRAKLDEAEARIAALSQPSGLRQHKGPAEAEKRATEQLEVIRRQDVHGVPVQTVAILCFLSFILAYLFF